MNSTLESTISESNDVLAARADERLAHAYEQIARADEQLARVTERLMKMEQDAAYHPSALPVERSSRGRPALRGFIGLLLAAGIGAAAFVSQSSYGDEARHVIAQWAPGLFSTLSLPSANPGLLAQPSASGVQVAAADTAPLPTSSAKTPTQDNAPAAAPTSAELARLLETMSRVLANVEQGVEQLKANQEQMASDNAKAVEELKARQEQVASDNARAVEQLRASQEQMARLVAKASEQTSRPKPSPQPARPIAAQPRQPAPARSSPQARAQPQQDQ